VFEGFDYGNARLRAMRGRLLDHEAIERLVGLDLPELLDALARSSLRRDFERALPRFTGYRLFQETLRGSHARVLRAMQSYFAGAARDAVDRLVARVDLANVRTLLRGLARGAAPEEMVPELVPAGSLDDSALVELASAASARLAVEDMRVLGLPSRPVARELFDALPGFEQTRDPAVLEHALHVAWARGEAEAVASEPLLAASFAALVDQRNVLAAIRQGLAQAHGEEPRFFRDRERFLRGGHVSFAALDAVTAQTTPAGMAQVLLGARLSTSAHDALVAWSQDGDLSLLGRRLDAGRLSEDAARAGAGDPLGVAVPLSLATRKEIEVRNLRVLGAAAHWQLPASWARERLVA
jgi:vacuolar-type H+-ATPase subunit C/Vma6